MVPEHDAGSLALANSGKDTNSSQFYILTDKEAQLDFGLDGTYVVFGGVISGMDVVRAVEALGDDTGTVRGKAVIADCGQL